MRRTLDPCQQGDGGVTGMLAMTGLPRPRWQNESYVCSLFNRQLGTGEALMRAA